MAASGAGAVVATGIALENNPPPKKSNSLNVSVPKESRWSEGMWSETDKKIFADSMASQDPNLLFTVQRMGRMLQENLARRPSTSTISDLFTDRDYAGQPIIIQIHTVQHAVDNFFKPAAVGKETIYGPLIPFAQQVSETAQPNREAWGPRDIALTRLFTNLKWTAQDSDLALQLRVAQNLIYPWTHKRAIMFLDKEYPFFQSPQNGPEKNAFLIHNSVARAQVDSKTKMEYKAVDAANIWTNFAILVSYLHAKEAGMLSDPDLLGFADLDAYAKYFMNVGALTRDTRTGKYKWEGTEDQLDRTWMVGTLNVMAGKIRTQEVPHTLPKHTTFNA